MRMLPLCALLLVTISPACREGALEFGKAGRGNFNREFPQIVSEYGGRPRLTNDLPALDAAWTLKKDKNGFSMRVSNVTFDDVERSLFAMFGGAGLSFEQGGDVLMESCLFKASDVGVALHAFNKTNVVVINVIRGTTNKYYPIGK